MAQARHQSDDSEDGQRSGFYGSMLSLGDTNVAARGSLQRIEDDAQPRYWVYVTYSVADDDVPLPPDDLNPISDLLEMGSGLFGDISIQYEATFSYNTDEGAESRVSVPTPLILSDPSSRHGLTHIESVTLSRRENGQPTHTVTVEVSEARKSIEHTVSFAASSNLSQDSMKQAFGITRQMSVALIVQEIGK